MEGCGGARAGGVEVEWWGVPTECAARVVSQLLARIGFLVRTYSFALVLSSRDDGDIRALRNLICDPLLANGDVRARINRGLAMFLCNRRHCPQKSS